MDTVKNNEKPIEFYVKRISHFMRGIRLGKNLTQSDIARSIEVSISTVSRIEAERLDSMTLDNLLKMSRLAEMRFSNFVLYLERNFGNEGYDLAPWQREAISALAKLNYRTRLKLIKKFLLGNSTSKQDRLIELMIELSDLKESTIDRLFEFVTDLKNEKDK